MVLLLGWAFVQPRVDGGPHTAPSVEPRPRAPRPETASPKASGRGRTENAGRVATEHERAEDAFSSSASCAALVGRGGRLERSPGSARFASWNLHWFPDGVPGQKEVGVDVAWLACALAWLDADVIAVQEVKQSPKAEQALASLLGELNRWSGARYVARLDDCGRRVPQHVGLIWNEARVAASELTTVAALNPHGTACESQLRPGLAARFRFPGGLDLQTVSAHFKSMTDSRAFGLRTASFAAVPGVLLAMTQASRDPDFLLLGDLNTMGCKDCAPPVSAGEELATVQKQLLAGGLRLVPADAVGSQLYAGRLSLLDHALAATAMRELSPATRSHLAGICAAGRASTDRDRKQQRRRLSDHCPLVLDLTDRDLD